MYKLIVHSHTQWSHIYFDYIYTYETFRHVPIFNSWNDFMGMLMEALSWELLAGDTRTYSASDYRRHTRKYHQATVFTSMGTEIKLLPGNDLYVYRYMARFALWSQSYIQTANKSQYDQLYIFNSTEATTKWLDIKSIGQSNAMPDWDATSSNI